jgi:hypothetical protein
MAFVKITKGPHGVSRGTVNTVPAIRLGSYRNETGRSVYVAMTVALVKQLGWKVTEGEKRVTFKMSINEGVGEDAGFWLLEEDPENGYALGAEKNKSQSFSTSIQYSKLKHYVLNDDSVPIAETEFDIQGNALLVQVPDWLRYNPQSYKEDKPKLELTPPKEEKKKPHPTLSVVTKNEDADEVRLNRKQRRLAAHVLTRAMR